MRNVSRVTHGKCNLSRHNKKHILIEQINHLDSNILSICVMSDHVLKYLTQLN